MEQMPGNKRYICPRCHLPAIMSVVIRPQDYICPAAKKLVMAAEVALAKGIKKL